MATFELYLRKEFNDAWQGKDPFIAADQIEGKVYRELEQRKTLAFEQGGNNYFIKIHKRVLWSEIIKNLIQLRLPVVSAKNEWTAIAELKKIGITTLVPAAYGKRGWRPSTLESFLVTEDVGSNQSLEELCATWADNPPEFVFKKGLISTVAIVAKKMHNHGICHRDFYICHFLLSNNDKKLTLIDLHRALFKRNLAKRWLIKDIGGLYFSTLNISLSKKDRFRFMKIYSGKGLRETLLQDKSFWQKVEKRALSINRSVLKG